MAEKNFKNTSGKDLEVYCDSGLKAKIGTIYKNSTCKCLGIIDGKALLKYKVTATGAYKVGFVDYKKGII